MTTINSLAINFDDPFQDLSSTEVNNLLNHFTIRSDGNALPVSAFSRIETSATQNDGDPNDWLDIVFADDFDTNSLSENLTIDYDGQGGLLGLNGDPTPAFSSEVEVVDDRNEDNFFDQTGIDTSPPVFESLSLSQNSVDVSSSDQTLTFTARITDDLSGITEKFNNPGFAQVALKARPASNLLALRLMQIIE